MLAKKGPCRSTNQTSHNDSALLQKMSLKLAYHLHALSISTVYKIETNVQILEKVKTYAKKPNLSRPKKEKII